MFRAASGRPTLSGAAALAVVSASTATVAAVTGHSVIATQVADAAPVPLTVVNAQFAEQGLAPAVAADAVLTERSERSHVRVVAFRQLAADRIEAAHRAARAAHRRALLSANPKVIARAMLGRYGWGASQFGCLDRLWMRESRWSLTVSNSSSGAYGIPQALPGSKMASAGSDWRHNPITQITWGLGYIRERYGSPCGAWSHSEAHGWY